MFALVGLGNPERRYTGTRHNIGFEVADNLAIRLHCSFKEGRGEYMFARGSASDVDLLIVKPLTYMNESGIAVSEIQEQFELQADHILVVCDDFQLPLGQLRLRLRGSDGGHNGLYSIIYQLQTDEFPRLRCGIGSSSMPVDKNRMADFVLDTFTADERPTVETMIRNAAEACLIAATEGMTPAMNRFNTRQQSENDSPASS